MADEDSFDEGPSPETVQGKKSDRKFEWTDARKAAFDKCREARKKSLDMRKEMSEAQKVENKSLRTQVKQALNSKEKMKEFLEKQKESEKPVAPTPTPAETKPNEVKDDDDIVVIKKKLSQKQPKRKVIVMSESSSDSEESVQVIKKKSKKKHIEALKAEIDEVKSVLRKEMDEKIANKKSYSINMHYAEDHPRKPIAKDNPPVEPKKEEPSTGPSYMFL